MDAEGAATLAATLKNDSRKYPDRGDPRFIPGGLIFPDLRPGFAHERDDVRLAADARIGHQATEPQPRRGGVR